MLLARLLARRQKSFRRDPRLLFGQPLKKSGRLSVSARLSSRISNLILVMLKSVNNRPAPSSWWHRAGWVLAFAGWAVIAPPSPPTTRMRRRTTLRPTRHPAIPLDQLAVVHFSGDPSRIDPALNHGIAQPFPATQSRARQRASRGEPPGGRHLPRHHPQDQPTARGGASRRSPPRRLQRKRPGHQRPRPVLRRPAPVPGGTCVRHLLPAHGGNHPPAIR